MPNKIPDSERPGLGQSMPLGDTGDGDTGVPELEQGISNRAGDTGKAKSDDDAGEDPDELMRDEDDTDGHV